MKRFSKWLFALCFLTTLFLSVPQSLRADPPGGDCDPLDPGCPIDGGLTALLVIGAGYGIKKMRDAKKIKE